MLERFIPGRFRDRHRSEVLAFGSGSEGSRHMGRTRDVLALRADGEEFVIEATISHMAVAGRQLYTVIHRDVTERVNAETELRDSKARLDAALASMSDAVFISDEQGRFVEINEAFATFHRFADKPSCRKTLAEYPEILEVTLPDGRPAALEQWAVPRALRGETATNVEYGLRRKDSGEKWIGSYSFAPIRNGGGAIVGSVVTARDITALKQVQTDLEESNAALQRLIASQDRVQEDERRRIARELHDELQQTLAAIRMDLAEIANAPAGDDGARRRLLARSDGLLAGAITATRRIVGDLRPPILEDLGLAPALQALARDFARRSGMACEVRAPERLGEMLGEAPATALCLYRIAQEALNNAAKHSQARNVQIRLAIASAHEIALTVSDDGLGLSAADTRKTDSFGILGMRERARAQGGVVRVDRGPGGGTVLEAKIPLSPRPAEGQAPEPDPAAAAERGLAPAYRDSGPGGLDDADALPRLLGRAARLTLQGVIDALPGHVAVLDPQGVVRFVNRAWLEFARHNGDPPLQAIGPGANYLEVCRRAAPDDASALVVRQGLIDVIAAARADFSCEYACHSPEVQRWFRMYAATMTNGDILVAHFPR